jgi:hypothetical protein
MLPWLRRRKVSPLPVPATPLMIASSLLDAVQQDEISNVVVCTKRKDGSFYIAASTMNTTDMLMHEKSVVEKAMECFRS